MLAEKYLKGERKIQYSPEHDGYMGRLPITDSILDDRAENRLKKKLEHYTDEVEKIIRQELPSYVLRMNRLYLKRYEICNFD
ncbi:hypothetical protein [Enterococcus alishanensis]